MMKRLLAIVLCVCTVLAFSGCIRIVIKTDGDKTENDPAGSQSAPAEDIHDGGSEDPGKNDAADPGMSSDELDDIIEKLSLGGGYWDCPAQFNDFRLYFTTGSDGRHFVSMQKIGDDENGDWGPLETVECLITGCYDDASGETWRFTVNSKERPDIGIIGVVYDRLDDGFIMADNYFSSSVGFTEYIAVED